MYKVQAELYKSMYILQYSQFHDKEIIILSKLTKQKNYDKLTHVTGAVYKEHCVYVCSDKGKGNLHRLGELAFAIRLDVGITSLIVFLVQSQQAIVDLMHVHKIIIIIILKTAILN